MLLTCDVHLVKQILTRAHDFHAPVEVLGLYNIYGPTLAASEGEQWRLYRKITTPFFNKKTYGKVWKESLDKAERLSTQWSHGGDNTRVVDVKEQLMSKLNLRVIAKIFYDQELPYDAHNAMKDVAPTGHTLTFSEAINGVLSNLATVFSVPNWLLGELADPCCNIFRSFSDE
jgi:cytochrome P450